MTTEIEKTFFDTFGIEPSGKKCTCDVRDFAKCTTYYCTSCEKALEKRYPQITDRILLELICIANDAYIDLEGTDIESMKNNLLENFIFFRRDVKHQVQALFKEG